MKIFSKIRYENGLRRVFFFGIPVYAYAKLHKPSTQAKKPLQIWEHLNKYKYVLSWKSEIKTPEQNYKNVIWQLWLQGEDNAPYIVKKCMASIRRHSGGRQVIVLDKNSLKNFIDIPDHIEKKYSSGIIPNAHFSDFVRVALLKKYGGTWIDATVYLTAPIPETITNCKFFVFRTKQWTNFHQGAVSNKYLYGLNSKIYQYYNFFLCCSSWFIHSTGNSHIINKVYDLMSEYWANEDTLIDYFCFHYFITLCVIFSFDCQREYFQMPMFSNMYPHIMQSVALKDFDSELYHEIIKNCFIHKMTYLESKNGSFLDYLLNKEI